MSDSIFHWVAFIGSMLVQAAIAAFVYGKLTQTVSGTAEGLKSERTDRKDEIARIDRDQDQQWTKINSQGEAVAKIKGKLGMNGA